MHAGFDKSPIHLEFPEAVPAQYKKCVALFQHAGFDKSLIHLEFPEAVPAQYEKCVALFQHFVETCYSTYDVFLS